MRLVHRAYVALAAAASVALIAPAAAASPQDLFGFGARSSAMAGAGPASAQGYEAVYGSPALLAETHQKTLTLGFGLAREDLHADTPTVKQTLSTDEMKTLYIGAALPIPLGGVMRDRLTVGIGFLDPVKFLVRGKILYPERLQFPIVAPRVQSLAIILGFGLRLGDRVLIGAGYEALAAVVGQIVISVDPTGHTASRSDDQVIAAFAPILSAAVDLGEHFRVGLTARGELIAKFVIRIKAQDLGVNLPDFNVAGIAQYDPAQAAAEVRWSSIADLRGAIPIEKTGWIVVAGAIARRWSKYPGQVEQTVIENKDFGPPRPEAHDTVSPRLGAERAFALTSMAGMRLRVGYAYEPTPLPEQTKSAAVDDVRRSTTNLLDSNRHVLTAGVGLVFSDSLPLQLDAFAQLHVLTSRTHVKDADVPSDAPGTPQVTSSGTIVVLGMTLGVRF